MKKLFAILALVLGMVSCQTEPEALDVVVGGEQDVNITVSLPEGTRADSAEGFDLNNLNGYKVRYILEISYHGKLIRDVQISEAPSATFPVRLAPNRDYTFTVWADLVTATTVDKAEWFKTDLYYNTREGLDEIEVNVDEWTANTEARDAWTATQTVNYTSNNKNIGMTLKRPFAKVRVVATDIAEIRNFGIKPTNATVAYLSDVYVGFNAVEGKVVETSNRGKSHAFNYADVDTYEDYETSNQLTVFTDYLFVPADGNIKFSLSVFDNEKADDLIKKNDFNTTIPVVANKVTTIKGNVLTEGGDVKVTVDGTLGEGETIHYVEASNAAELQEAINESTEETVVVLSGDIVLGATPTTLATRSASNNSLTIAEGVTTVIDLNGKRISTVEQSTGRHYYAIYNYGNLTIKDSGENGAIVSRGIYNYGTMTLESGKLDACDGNGGYAVQCKTGSEFVMNGGSIVTSLEDDNLVDKGGYDATTLRIEDGAKATINGGIINNICDYTFAIDNHGEAIINNGTITSIHSTVSTYGTMTINGGTFTCNGLEGITAHALVAWDGSETTINGGTFNGKDNYNGFNIDACEGAVVNIYGGNFLPVHSGSLYGEGTINVMGGTFFDDPSARVVTGYKVAKNEEGNYTVAELVLNATFAQNDWSDIVFACENNRVPESWNVGDTKAMTIDGKDYQIRILGKNHDTYTAGGTAPLTFQIAEIYGTAPMNATQTNTTGWSGSKMRTETMAEIFEVMPVKDAIKAVNKETLNGTRDGLETTSDKLFLLSEVEVNGSVFFSNNFAEGSRYAFFGDVDSMKLNASYWLRGPGKSNAIGYTQINMSGYMGNGSAETACGVVFGFCF